MEHFTITLYDGDYISFEIGGLDMAFEVSEETADYLNGYCEEVLFEMGAAMPDQTDRGEERR